MRYSLGLSAFLLMAVAGSWARGHFMNPTPAPVDRLIANTESYIQEKPDDPQGYYTLARLHLMAFSVQSDRIPVFERADAKLPQFSETAWNMRGPKSRIDANKAVEHITASITNYRKTTSMRPGDGLYELGLGCAMEAAAPVSCFIGVPPGEGTPEKAGPAMAGQIVAIAFQEGTQPADAARAIRANLKAATPALAAELTRTPRASYYLTVAGLLQESYRHEAAEAYYRAFKAKAGEETKQKDRPMSGLMTYISYEAGRGFLRIAETDPCAGAWKDRMDEIKQALAKMEKQPMGAITPIVFSLHATHDLTSMLAPSLKVRFDLDGDGIVEERPWVRSDTVILVWDESRRGQITSGKQLFGSVTFFMFWRNGYEAMAALDDNRDGELRGSELNGLAIWQDRNSNAISDPGEVTPLSACGIQALSVRPSGDDHGSPTAPKGVQLQSGQWLPTWDWTLAD